MHLGVIPDGNRRYADEKGISNEEAYREAKQVIEQIGEQISNNKKWREEIGEITFYLLSEENLRRDNGELETLFKLLDEYIEEVANAYGDRNFRFNWATTNPSALPDSLVEKLRSLEEQFDTGDRQLNVLISYTGRRDIVQAAKNVEDISEDTIQENLQVKTDIDFVIRTGDNPHRECISGFPIWNSSYAEYYHIKKNFPDLEKDDIMEALDHYENLRKKEGR